MAYRDDLEAAQVRIAALESELAEQKSLVKVAPTALAPGRSVSRVVTGVEFSRRWQHQWQGQLSTTSINELAAQLQRQYAGRGEVTTTPNGLRLRLRGKFTNPPTETVVDVTSLPTADGNGSVEIDVTDQRNAIAVFGWMSIPMGIGAAAPLTFALSPGAALFSGWLVGASVFWLGGRLAVKHVVARRDRNALAMLNEVRQLIEPKIAPPDAAAAPQTR